MISGTITDGVCCYSRLHKEDENMVLNDDLYQSRSMVEIAGVRSPFFNLGAIDSLKHLVVPAVKVLGNTWRKRESFQNEM